MAKQQDMAPATAWGSNILPVVHSTQWYSAVVA